MEIAEIHEIRIATMKNEAITVVLTIPREAKGR
jgi:hypothetical protein